MTPLKPLENLRVRGVAAERYPLNTVCAHPECSEPADEGHHCFPRSQIKSDSWFVQIDSVDPESGDPVDVIVPHVTGLCRAHHEAVERHDAWIKLEDGVFVWYDRQAVDRPPNETTPEGIKIRQEMEWVSTGPLNPQPGSREGKPKRKRLSGEARMKRRTISIKVPDDEAENGGQVWDDTLEAVRTKLEKDGYKGASEKSVYVVLIAALVGYLQS